MKSTFDTTPTDLRGAVDHTGEIRLHRFEQTFQPSAWPRRSAPIVDGDAIGRTGLGTEVVRIPKYVSEREVVEAIAEADFIFGCMDGAEGRNVLNRLATCYLLPYVDLGVKLLADGTDTIEEVSTGRSLPPAGPLDPQLPRGVHSR